MKLPVTEGSPEEQKRDKEIYTLNIDTLEYAPRGKAKFATLEMTKPVDDVKKKITNAGRPVQIKRANFFRQMFLFIVLLCCLPHS